MKTGFQLILHVFLCLIAPLKAQTQIDWISTQNATNLLSNEITPMACDFRFELGVFKGSFVPTALNTADWSGNWVAAQRVRYRSDLKRLDMGSFTVNSNISPFTTGKLAYVWGFRGDPVVGEWILYRAASWVWPAASSGPPVAPLTWDAKNATAVIGDIKLSGSPYLMKTASVSNAVPPITTWAQWQADELEGETLIQPHQDADGDGTANILEFIFGTSPKTANPSLVQAANFLDVSGSNYLHLTVPRRVDRPATLLVEVSGDLVTWNSSNAHTAVVSSSNSSLTVRDLTPFGAAATKRFIRLKVTP
jgi:hypothetical protein